MRFITGPSVLWFVYFLSGVIALSSLDSSVATACLKYNALFKWNCTSNKKYSCLCQDINWLQTLTYCVNYGADHETPLKHAMRHIRLRCKSGDIDFTTEQLQQIYENGTLYTRPIISNDTTTRVIGTLIPDETTFDYYLTKYKQTSLFVTRSQWYGWGLIFYWVTIILISTIFNINRKMIGFKTFFQNVWIKRNVAIPSVGKHYKERTFLLFRCIPINFPTRLDALIVTVFVILTIIFCGMDYDIHLPHPNYPDQWRLNARMLNYRVDQMALTLFPVIYMFGIRNNPFIALSGFSIGSFNYFHRWCAYVASCLVLVHAVLWTVYSQRYSTYHHYISQEYFQWGIAATVMMFVLCSHSEKIFRDRFYEFFLFFHKAMNVIFIVGLYYHIASFGWLNWVWALVGIWAGDRFLRFGWIVINGGIHNATLTDCFNGVIKISIPKPRFFKYQPGMFVYLYFLGLNEPWFCSLQSHPFTILSEPQIDESQPGNLIIYFKVNKGITKRLLKRLEKSGKQSITCKVLLEGPYGVQLPQLTSITENYSGICAGLGITAVYPELYHAAQKTENIEGFSHNLTWIINNPSHVEWFHQELTLLSQLNCNVEIICTARTSNNTPVDEKMKGFKDKLQFTTATDSGSSATSTNDRYAKSHYEIQYIEARPDLGQLIASRISKSQNQSSQPTDLNILTCGPSSFNDKIRFHMTEELAKNISINVNFDEKSFTW
ncbi:similar to Saccharomyces cerevisiae YLR214W FRE1 Ferric reductase and cupric reductase, reduces siderophore-bound iron and oxidized copper prior to uptake by transporters [Maudiozyma barnettii]|uniref:Similar to Saccharomyces cerevisiae YLR214W FRE1 Ferric reductase and cupric reductase, reduces siderophore-bound iron and oxidized copper prior to uptake by transporters n=1 Tax=Maudiozyma barnettii TaxID=61262 RepID=A0A8H2ZGS0_9SACH|nr:ferric/cupric-chelate reductase [Kazachstania barnettii]CAB4253973.1 similar to Saccharomyces cerevisiae YLR214W FRE1 Ferric reductase and cupric reductase, reduces siderophore-bound iron and oxidized copper prior to uptake by transporters [Kazachstania barnettii]CAD1781723.1 similar to Saccharomyces cerevisiae YLR214W FRE1 Ferric reductase and cupric reductase, reduces siderophore-bound iron and oxidized copper prior to uptake by transporters [Kazachstania barnettii]